MDRIGKNDWKGFSKKVVRNEGNLLSRTPSVLPAIKGIIEVAGEAVKERVEKKRENEAKVIDRVKNLVSPYLSSKFVEIKDAVLGRENFLLAGKLRPPEEIMRLMKELTRAVGAGEISRVNEIAANLEEIFKDWREAEKIAEEIRKSEETEKKEEEVKTAMMYLKTYARGRVEPLLRSSEFAESLGRMIDIKILPERFPLPMLPSTYKKTSIKKPGKLSKGFDIPIPSAEERLFEKKYCKASDLPLKIIVPIIMGNLFDVEINARTDRESNDFRDGKVLDSKIPEIPSDLNYVKLLRQYAIHNGDLRYFYRVSPDTITNIMVQAEELVEIPDAGRLRRHLMAEMTKHLLYTPIDSLKEISELGDEALNEIMNFRGNVLGWGTYSEGKWHPSFTGSSIYPPQALDNFLFEYKNLYNFANSIWRDSVNKEREEVGKIINEKANEIKETCGISADTESESDDKQIISYADKILSYIYCFKEFKDYIWITFEYDKELVNNLLRSSYDEYPDMKNKICKLLQLIWEKMEELSKEDPYWYMDPGWGYPKGFLDFVKKAREFAKKAVLEAMEFEEEKKKDCEKKIKTLEKEKDEYVRMQSHYNSLFFQIPSGVMYSGWVNYVVSILRRSCVRKQVVTEPYLPLVLLQSLGAYGEIPKQPYILERLDIEREGNFFSAHPEVGLLKEYRLEIRHKGFGIGSHIYSQSLFPGETVSLEMRSYSKYKETQTESSAENILEETTSETLSDFSRELKAQLQWEKKISESTSKNIGGNLSANILGIVKIGGSGGGKWTSQTDERSFSDHMENLLNKLSTKLSQKRQVSFEVKREITTEKEVESEIKTTRTYSNNNKEKTLTINFFQMTRELETSLHLDNMKFFYTSGRYPIVKIFAKRDLKYIAQAIDKIMESEEPYENLKKILEEMNMSSEEFLKYIVEPLPPEVWDYFPEDAFIIILGTPYNLVLPLSETNAFLVSTFKFEKAEEINNLIWRVIGNGGASPGGLGVCAFPFPFESEGEIPWWPEDWEHGAEIGDFLVIADEIKIKGEAEERYLPNIDIRYKHSAKVPSRYIDDSEDGYFSLPKLIWWKNYIINTNGVYAENMLGTCSAIEEYLRDHRKLDVKQKAIEVGREEIEFEWLKRKDAVGTDQAFERRLEIEKENQELERAKLKAEVERLKATIPIVPPKREDYDTDEEYNAAFGIYQNLMAIKSKKEIDIKVPPDSKVSVSANIGDKESNTMLNVEES